MESDEQAARVGGGSDSRVSVVAIALSGSSKSKYLIKWALENLIQQGIPERVRFRFLNVFPEISSVPTPLGGGIPMAQVREDVAAAYRKEVHCQAREKIFPHKMMCEKKKVQVEVDMIESDDIVGSISEKISRHGIRKLILGGSSTGGLFSSSYWTPKGQNLSSKISECCPTFCTVYVVSKGKLTSVRPSDPEALPTSKDDHTQRFSNYSPKFTLDPKSEWTSRSSPDAYAKFLPASPQSKHLRAVSTVNLKHYEGKTNTKDAQNLSYYTRDCEDDASSSSSSSDIVDLKSKISRYTKSFTTDENGSWTTDRSSSLNGSTEFSFGSQVNLNLELEKLRMELRQVHGMYAKAQTEAVDASRKLNDLHQQRIEEAIRLQEMMSYKEEKAKELAEMEKTKYDAAKREAEYAKEYAKTEAALKIAAEKKSIQDVKTMQKLENSLACPVQHYHEFTWEEITSATSDFSNDLRIGMGSYGTVYKCNLRHTTAAVKILHSMAANRNKQFQQELEILSKIRHPHLLTLLGACPGQGCLVYEYMENGSLEERLFKKNNTPPIPWFERFRIAREVALALLFLHNSKPKPIIHRDLKPENILLDGNFVSKIGDVGLSTMLYPDTLNVTTFYKDTSPVGTLCYIDPEYQRTGLVSPKSDVYAFGMVVLQLLTAKPAMALARTMEMAVNEDHLAGVLDSEAGNWPTEETKELAILGLSCTELRHKDRPDLKNQILPVLEKLKTVADKARDLALSGLSSLPLHFICPLLKDVMNDPVVAADGYTYDRKAIEEWLEENESSPVTSLPLLSKILIPNYTLLSAIVDWKSGK